MLQNYQTEKEKARAAGDSENRWTEHTPRNLFRCGSEDHLIAKCPKSLKEKDKRRNKVHLNKKVNCTFDKGENNNE